MADVLIMAMTYMRSGICTAGFVHDPSLSEQVCWVRPVKEHGTLLLGDMTTSAGEVVRMGDVVDLALLSHRPHHNHVEDWVTDFLHRRPRILRRLTAEKRSQFLANHCDPNPGDVLSAPNRSLCLIRPDELWAYFSQDAYSGKYEVRLGFHLSAAPNLDASSSRGLAVADLKWRALGRQWLADRRELQLAHSDLLHRLQADEIYLSIGLSRLFQGKQWSLVIGIHPVPDYELAIDYNCP